MTKHYIKFLHPGSFWPEETIIEIEDRSKIPEVPKTAFAYEFFDMEETELDGEKLYGNRKNKSARTYLGEVLTYEQVEKSVPDSRILLSNMKSNGWEKIVKTRMGNFQPLEEGDTVIIL